MLNTEAKNLLDKYLWGNKNVTLEDVFKKQIAKKRLSPIKLQCKRCIYRDCIYNNTKEEDVPKPGDWKTFYLFVKCFECNDRKEN